VEKLLNYCHTRGVSAIKLTLISNLSWLLGGRIGVGLAGDCGICLAIVNEDGVFVFTNNIEKGRLQAEEFGYGVSIYDEPWEKNALPDFENDLMNNSSSTIIPSFTGSTTRIAPIALLIILSAAYPASAISYLFLYFSTIAMQGSDKSIPTPRWATLKYLLPKSIDNSIIFHLLGILIRSF